MKKININKNWVFNKPEEQPKNINLPHTWNALDGQNGGNNYFRGKCLYTKTCKVEFEQDQKVFIELEGANSICNVLVNGTEVGEHRGGYSIFRFELTEHIKSDESFDLEVFVDNTHYEDVYPLMADFTFMGGLYRDVNLLVVNKIHFDLMDFGSQGIYVHQDSVTEESAKLRIETSVSGSDDYTVALRLVDHRGSIVTYGVGVGNESVLYISNPHLWQGVEDPYMYTLEADLLVDGVVQDIRRVPLGLRSIAIDPERGFILNGKVTPLNGVSRHQDKKDMGWALGYDEMYEDIQIIREMGANSIRLAHYQHDQKFYEICDKVGIISWAEIPYISRSSETDTTGANAKSQMRELIKQNINHPSIVMWGVQNEITIAGKENDNIEGIVTELNALTKELDPNRLTAQAQVGHHPDDDSMNNITDIIGYNKYFGWYYDETKDMGIWLDNFHKNFPQIPVGLTEYGCEAILDYHNDDPKKSDYSEEYQTKYHHDLLKIFNARPFIWGTYVWNMFDFASDLRDEGGVQGMNNKGLVTHDRKTRKDSFYVYKSYWSKEEVLHICSKRYKKRVKGSTAINIITNMEEVELIVNGKSMGNKSSIENSVTFDIKLNRGENVIIALSGNLTDTILIEGVKKAEESYICTSEKSNPIGDVANWFGSNEGDEEVPDLVFIDGCFSIKDKISHILKSEDGEAVLREHMAPMFEHSMFPMIKSFTIEKLKAMQPDMFSRRFIYDLNESLNKVAK